MAITPLSIVHVNASCSNLETSLSFYRDAVGLTPLTRTNPVPQPGAAFGFAGAPGETVQWDAHLLHDDRGLARPALDLLEWKEPRPVGRPPGEANHLGLYRLALHSGA